MYYILIFFSRVFHKISKILQSLSIYFESNNSHKKAVIDSTRKYNMHSSLNEKYYLDQYWRFIESHLEDLQKQVTVYDLGCGQGRFSFKLADHFNEGKIYSCDLSKYAIEYAKDFASKNNYSDRINFENQEIFDFVNQHKTNSADLIIITEVLFYYPNWQVDIDKILALLKPGGKVCISFRSQYYNLLNTLQMSDTSKLQMIINERQGKIFNGIGTFTWNTSGEIKQLIKSKQLILESLYGIGNLSGIKGDPNNNICEPSNLTDEEQKKLMEAELYLGKDILDSGRYILAIAKKPYD